MMKYLRIILFFCMFVFICNSISAQRQRQDSTLFNSPFRIIINPCLMISQLEFGAMFEYRFGKHFSIEVGGGGYPEGYTIRAGLRFYLKRGYYLNQVFFYRHVIKQYERNDTWYYHTDHDTLHGNIIPSGNGDYILSVTAHDNKQVLATEFLVGRELYRGKHSIDIYVGIGYRYKYRVLEGIKESTNSSLFNSFFSYGSNPTHGFQTPPDAKYILYNYLPSLQAGVQISIPCKRKKNLPESK